MRATLAIVASIALAACGNAPGKQLQPSVSTKPNPPDGTGHLVMADLGPVASKHFTATPAQLNGTLSLRPNGCVTATIDGLEHMPIWPNGTAVSDSEASPGHYTVTLSTGTTLLVSAAGADGFAAMGIVDDVQASFLDAQGLPGKVQQLLDYCGAPGRAIAFPDASSFVKR